MSSGKRRSGFQITSVTSDVSGGLAGQSPPSLALNFLRQGSSSQPNSPSSKRKYSSHDVPGSRFRVVRLAMRGARAGGQDESCRRGRWTCLDFKEEQEGSGFRPVIDHMRHAHSLESLEMIGCSRGKSGVLSQETAHLLADPMSGLEGAGFIRRGSPPSPPHQDTVNGRTFDRKEPMTARVSHSSTRPPPPPHPQYAPPPSCLDVDSGGRSVLRLSHSPPSAPPTGPCRPTLTSIQTPAAFTLDHSIFGPPGGSSCVLSMDSKIQQAMDLVKSHLLLAVREEVALLRERIRELQEKNQELERENHILRALTHSARTT